MGRAGRRARNQARHARLAFVQAHVALITLTALGYAAIAAFILLVIDFPSAAWRQGALTVGAFWLIAWLLSQDGQEKTRLGAAAERWTSAALRKARRAGWKVVDAIPFDGYDIDHVAVSRFGVFAIETKFTSIAWRDIAGELEAPFCDPIDQALRNARTVKLLLRSLGIDVDVMPVLAVWGAGSRTLSATNIHGVIVLVGRESRDWIRALPTRGACLDEAGIGAVVRALEAFIDMRDRHERQRSREARKAS